METLYFLVSMVFRKLIPPQPDPRMTMFGFLSLWSSTIFKVWKEDGPAPFLSTEVTFSSMLVMDEDAEDDREPRLDFEAATVDAHLIRDVALTFCSLYL